MLRQPADAARLNAAIAHAPVTWRAADPTTLIVERLDVLTAVFHRASGITHLLASPAFEILALLGAAEMSLDALMAALASEYDLADPDPASLAARLGELAAAGLIVRSAA